jgi:cell division protein FtsW
MSIESGFESIVVPHPGRPAREAIERRTLADWWRNRFGGMWNPRMLQADLGLVVIVVALVCIGLLMIYSASLPGHVLRPEWDLNHYFLRQMLWMGVGLAAMAVAWSIRYTYWKRWAVFIMGLCIVLLVLVYFFGRGDFGSRRYLFHSSFQPSELAKLILVVYMAVWMASKGDKLKALGFGLAPFSVLTGLVGGLIIVEPDRSTAILIIAVAFSMFIVAGADLRQIAIVVPAAGAVLYGVIRFPTYSNTRLQEFLDAWRNPLAGEPTQMQGFVKCLQSGGFMGQGLANGVVKGSVGVIHSDGIMAVVGEEFGLMGCLVVTGLFVMLAYRGLRIARNAADPMGLIMAAGITFWLTYQALINIAVVTGTIPTTGIPLTFVSYGGSALVTAMAGVGLLLSISSSPYDEDEGVETRARTVVRRRDRWSRLPRSSGR